MIKKNSKTRRIKTFDEMFTKKKQKKILGYFLFSHTLSSALSGLTSVFGMGTGVPHLLSLPRKYIEK